MNNRQQYIDSLGLKISGAQLELLHAYLNLVWEKKDFLNLTSVQDKQEIWDRHILDALTAAPLVTGLTLADCGSGAGYIGIALKIVLPHIETTLIESLEKRCAFMNWAIMKLGLKDIYVLNARVGEGGFKKEFDFVTQRAMGKIEDVLPLCAKILDKNGRFLAYQALDSHCGAQLLSALAMEEEKTFKYTLPQEEKERKLVVFKWI